MAKLAEPKKILKVHGDRAKIQQQLDNALTAYVRYKGAAFYVSKNVLGLYYVKPAHYAQFRSTPLKDWVPHIKKHEWIKTFKSYRKP